MPAPLADIDPDEFDRRHPHQRPRHVPRDEVSRSRRCSASGGGAIVNMASVAGVRATTNLAAYVAGKAAIIGLTEVAALDYADRGIRVNVVAPGPILTHHLERAGAEAQRLAGQSVPMRRVGTTDRGRRRRAVAVLATQSRSSPAPPSRSTAASSPGTSRRRCTARARAWPRHRAAMTTDRRPDERRPIMIHDHRRRSASSARGGRTPRSPATPSPSTAMVTDDFRLVGPFGFVLDKPAVARPLRLRRLRHHAS